MKISTKLTLTGMATVVALAAAAATTSWTHHRTEAALNDADTRTRHIDLCRDMSETCSLLERAATDSIHDRNHGRPSGDRLAGIEDAIAHLESGARTLTDRATTEGENQKVERLNKALPLATEAANGRLLELLETRGNLREVTHQEFCAFRDHLTRLHHTVEESLSAIESSVRQRLENAPDPQQLTTAIDRTGKLRAAHLELMLAAAEAVANTEHRASFEDRRQRFSEPLETLRTQTESVAAISKAEAETGHLETMAEAVGQLAQTIQVDLAQQVGEGFERSRTFDAAFVEIKQDLDSNGDVVREQLNHVETWARAHLAHSDRQELIDAVDLVARLRTTHLEMTLTAMEALIDESEASPSQDRLPHFDDALVAEQDSLLALAETEEERQLIASAIDAIAELEATLRNDLTTLIKTQAESVREIEDTSAAYDRDLAESSRKLKRLLDSLHESFRPDASPVPRPAESLQEQSARFEAVGEWLAEATAHLPKRGDRFGEVGDLAEVAAEWLGDTGKSFQHAAYRLKEADRQLEAARAVVRQQIASVEKSRLDLMLAASTAQHDAQDDVAQTWVEAITAAAEALRADYATLSQTLLEGQAATSTAEIDASVKDLADAVEVRLVNLINRTTQDREAIEHEMSQFRSDLEQRAVRFQRAVTTLDQAFRVRLADDETQETLDCIDLVAALRTCHLQLKLAALDALLSRSEGRITDDRMARIDELAASQGEKLLALGSLSLDLEDDGWAKALNAAAEHVVSVLRVDLAQLIQHNARHASDFDAALTELRDRLDTYSHAYHENLASLDSALRERLDPNDTLRYRAILSAVAEFRTHHLTLMLAAADSIIDRDSGAIDAQVVAQIDDSISHLAKDHEKLATLIHESPEKEVAQQLAPRIQSLTVGIRNDLAQLITRTAIANHQADQAFAALDREIGTHTETVRSTLADLVTSTEKQQAAAATAFNKDLASAFALVTAALAAGALASIVILPRIGRSISRRLRAAAAAMDAVADSDFSQRLDLHSRDEVGLLSQALNTANAATAETIQQIKEAAQRESQEQAARLEEQRLRDEEEQRQTHEQDARDRTGLMEECRSHEEQAAEERRCSQETSLELTSLRHRIGNLIEVVEAASQGNLTPHVASDGEEPIDELASGISRLLHDMAAILSEVSDSAGRFTQDARTASDSSQDLVRGTHEQGDNVEQVKASIEELTQSVEAIRGSAAEADSLANQTNQLAEEGGQTVQKSIEGMELIRATSEQVTEIAHVISEIADQTNMLALNAAIEAARAGEHGMGFAIVADEVRKLSERSNQAATQISGLTKESGQRIKEGAQLSEQTGEALSRIIEGVHATSQKISEIAAATVQQAGCATQASQAIKKVAKNTEQTAAEAEQIAASSQQFGTVAESLTRMSLGLSGPSGQ